MTSVVSNVPLYVITIELHSVKKDAEAIDRALIIVRYYRTVEHGVVYMWQSCQNHIKSYTCLGL